jgi:hypothetical protein
MYNGQIRINGAIAIDFIRGDMHPEYSIRFAVDNTWDITRNNKLI